jgi:hypothetical protein
LFAGCHETVQQFGSTWSQQGQFAELIFKAIVTSCIPFNFVENSYLQKAFSVFGMQGMTRKHVSGKKLDGLSANEEASMVAKLANEDYPAGSSDGWCKKFCADGAGLTDFCALEDFSVLWDAKDCTGFPSLPKLSPSFYQSWGQKSWAARTPVTSWGPGLLTTPAATLLPYAS